MGLCSSGIDVSSDFTISRASAMRDFAAITTT